MAGSMKVKRAQKRVKPSREVMVRNTLQNKVAKLATITRKNPNDISAGIAYSQARYDLSVM